jgi:FkbM family methyltransferase
MSREAAQAFLTRALDIKFPYHRMGKIDSLDLFGTSELMILELYHANRTRWHKVLDIGANLGLHSILMSRLGWQVMAYEPDYAHFPRLLANLEANGCKTVTPCMAAVHTENGHAHFTRVLDNLTGNHLVGYKDSYGPREDVLVPTVDCRPLFDWADFAKIDCEGNEADILLTTTAKQMAHLSCVVEVRNEANAKLLYDHFRGLKVPLWSQKIGWGKVSGVADMPHMNREGSIFIGHDAPNIVTK